MLNVTDEAGRIIRAVAEQQQVPDNGGIRITLDPPSMSSDGSERPAPAFQLALVPDAEPEDVQVPVPGGGRVFVDQGAATHLDDKVLDAGVTSDGKVAFRVVTSS